MKRSFRERLKLVRDELETADIVFKVANWCLIIIAAKVGAELTHSRILASLGGVLSFLIVWPFLRLIDVEPIWGKQWRAIIIGLCWIALCTTVAWVATYEFNKIATALVQSHMRH